MDPLFFPTPADFRRWLETHHAAAAELWVGYYKKSSGIPSITWEESVDQALCFGWIDGIRRSIDAVSFTNRFTPRRLRSNWSARNIARVEALKVAGLMAPAGLAAYEARRQDRDGYSSAQRPADLDGADLERLRGDAAAWAYWQAAAPSYRKAAAWWVISAKREETRLKRLEQLIADSAAGRTVPPLTRPGSGSRSGR